MSVVHAIIIVMTKGICRNQCQHDTFDLWTNCQHICVHKRVVGKQLRLVFQFLSWVFALMCGWLNDAQYMTTVFKWDIIIPMGSSTIMFSITTNFLHTIVYARHYTNMWGKVYRSLTFRKNWYSVSSLEYTLCAVSTKL